MTVSLVQSIQNQLLQHALGITHSAKSQVANIGFGGDEGHGYLMAEFAFSQIRIHDKGDFIGRSETGGHLHYAYHDVARVLEEFLPGGIGLFRMVNGTHQMGIAPRPKAVDLSTPVWGRWR